MTISQRIFVLLKQKGKKQKELAEYTGISTSAISAWNKNNTNPTAESLSTIADFLEVSLDYLLTGKEKTIEETEDIKRLLKNYNIVDDISKQLIQERAQVLAELAVEQKVKNQKTEQVQRTIEVSPLAADEQPDPNEQESEEDDGYYIDFYDFPASAGTGLLIDDTVVEKLMIKNSPEALSADYAIPISGDSMEPSFSSGDTVLIKSCQKISEGQIGIFVLDGDVYIKEYGGNCLISHNSGYSPIMLKGYRTAVCLGRVLGKAEVIE